jgi:hypothetical protein
MEWLSVLAHEIDVIAHIARSASAADLERPVAGCPGWMVHDLVVHVGRIERWVVHAVRKQELLDDVTQGPGADLPGWYEEGAADLLLALDTDPAAPAATFAPDKTSRSTRSSPTTASTRSPRCSGLGRYGWGARRCLPTVCSSAPPTPMANGSSVTPRRRRSAALRLTCSSCSCTATHPTHSPGQAMSNRADPYSPSPWPPDSPNVSCRTPSDRYRQRDEAAESGV